MKIRLACLATLAAFSFVAASAKAETYALLIGINDYPDVVDANGNPVKGADGNPINPDLSGAVNDVKKYRDLFVNKFSVKADNIKMLLDKQAGESGFIDGMKWLINTAKPGDNVVFIYSGHGAQVDAKDEPDGKEEVIVLADDKLVPGDLFNQIAQSLSKAGINSTYIFDSCFSGGMSRPDAMFDGKPLSKLNRKFMPYQLANKLARVPDSKLNGVRTITKQAATTSSQFAFLFAGQENQTTTDLDFKDEKVPDHGLFTLVMTTLLEKLPAAPIEELMTAIIDYLAEKKFEQKPTFEFSSPDRGKKPLLGN